MKLLVAAVGGASIGFLLGTALIPPSREDVVRAAEELVPAEATDVLVDPLTGSPIIVGHDFYVVVDIVAERQTPVALGQGLVDHAARHGWQLDASGRLGPIRTYELTRWPMQVAARVDSQARGGEPTDTGLAHLRVEEDRDAVFRAVAGVSLLGAALGTGAALVLGRAFMGGPRPT